MYTLLIRRVYVLCVLHSAQYVLHNAQYVLHSAQYVLHNANWFCAIKMKFMFCEVGTDVCWPGSSVGIATELRARRSGIESR